jgi:hypothetical protein
MSRDFNVTFISFSDEEEKGPLFYIQKTCGFLNIKK